MVAFHGGGSKQVLSWMLVLKHFSCGLMSVWWQQHEILIAERRDFILIFLWELSLVQSFPVSHSLACIFSKTWLIFLILLKLFVSHLQRTGGCWLFFSGNTLCEWGHAPFSPEQPLPVSPAAPQGRDAGAGVDTQIFLPISAQVMEGGELLAKSLMMPAPPDMRSWKTRDFSFVACSVFLILLQVNCFLILGGARAYCDKIRGDGFKLEEGWLILALRKKFFINEGDKNAVVSTTDCPEMLWKHSRLDGPWNNLTSSRCPCLLQGRWNKMRFKVPLNPNNRMILWSPHPISLLQQGTLWEHYTEVCPDGFWATSPGKKTPKPPWAVCANAQSPT